MQIKPAKELTVYVKAYELAMQIFHLSKPFPLEEKYAFTNQIRRSSRSVPMNLRKDWSKRRYESHFISKLTDCDGESNETDTSLDLAKDCGSLTESRHHALTELNRELGRMLGSMINHPEPFLINPTKS